MRKEPTFISNRNYHTTLLFISVLSKESAHACGLGVAVLDHGALGIFARRQSKRKIVVLCPFRSRLFYIFFLVREGA